MGKRKSDESREKMILQDISNLFLKNKILAVLLIVINLAGTVYGFYYYQQQFLETPFYLWLFIPDCPLYTLLFAVVIFLYVFKKKTNAFLTVLTAFGLIKYGLWTVTTILLYSNYFFAVNPLMYSILFFLHAGMILESFVLIPLIRRINILPIFLWFLLNDFSDYFAFGTIPHPIPFIDSNPIFLILESFFVTIVLSLLFFKK